MKTFLKLFIVLFIVTMFTSCGSKKQPSLDEKNGTRETCQMYLIKYNDKYGYISNCDSVFVPFKFDDADGFSEGMARVKLESKWGYISGTEYAINPQYEDALPFSEGLAAVKTGDLWGYINTEGDYVIEPKFESASTFCEGLACVSIISTSSDGLPMWKWGFIDKTGEFVIKPQFEGAQDFSEGLAPIRVSFLGKWGYIDNTGKIVIDPQFEDASDFTEGLAAVEIRKGEWGYINKNGDLVIKPRKALFALPFSCGIGHFLIKSPNKDISVDTTGAIIDVDFNSILVDGIATIVIDNKYGYVDRQGNILISPQFDEAHLFDGNYAPVRIDDCWGLVDKSGNVLWRTKGMNPINETTIKENN